MLMTHFGLHHGHDGRTRFIHNHLWVWWDHNMVKHPSSTPTRVTANRIVENAFFIDPCVIIMGEGVVDLMRGELRLKVNSSFEGTDSNIFHSF